MCILVMIAVPPRAAEGLLSHGSWKGLSVAPCKNPCALAVAAATGQGFVSLELTLHDGCSCGLHHAAVESTEPNRRERAEAKYRDLGWSEAKIQRALEAMKPEEEAAPPGLDVRVVELLGATVREHGKGSVWIHWFSGDFNREPFTLANAGACALEDLPACAEDYRQETLLTVVRR